MVKYTKSNITSKKGVNYIRSVIEDRGSLFHKIELENDLGIDALIEFIRDEKPLYKQVALQIKSGSSYYNKKENECIIPIGKHRDYWLNYPLPVFGIVYVPLFKCAFWVDIKKWLMNNKQESMVRFEIGELNRFDEENFIKLFMPKIMSEIPDLSLVEAVEYFNSNKHEEFYLGLIVLFRKHINSFKTWELMVNYFIEKPIDEIPNNLIYYLAHIPWHSDIWHSGEPISQEVRNYVNNLIQKFDYDEVLKLLHFIDEENGIARGTYGQSCEAIISSLHNSSSYLSEIIRNEDLKLSIRHFAALILAMNEGKNAIPTISKLLDSDSWYAQELINHLEKHGDITPYI